MDVPWWGWLIVGAVGSPLVILAAWTVVCFIVLINMDR